MVFDRVLTDAEISGDVLLGWPAITRFMISCHRSVSVATRAAAVLCSSDQVCKRADGAAHRGQQAETEREHHRADHRSDGGARNSQRAKNRQGYPAPEGIAPGPSASPRPCRSTGGSNGAAARGTREPSGRRRQDDLGAGPGEGGRGPGDAGQSRFHTAIAVL